MGSCRESSGQQRQDRGAARWHLDPAEGGDVRDYQKHLGAAWKVSRGWYWRLQRNPEPCSLALLVPRYRTDPATGALIMKTHEFILLCLELISLASRGQVWAGPEMSLCQAHFGGSLLKCTSPSSHVSCASPLPLLSDLNRFTEQKCRIMGPNFISGT